MFGMSGRDVMLGSWVVLRHTGRRPAPSFRHTGMASVTLLDARA